jgi:DNA modification methylase
MILGDSLQVMASLSERESLKGKVQCIYFDPPYGIKFNSNWQVSTQSRDVKDGKPTDISREPEQVKAFRDTWKDDIHSYLAYLRDRFTAMRDLLTESGSVFVQIGDENVHRVRAVMDEVFGARNFVSEITVQKTGGQTSDYLSSIQDYILWYARSGSQLKYRQPYRKKELGVGHGSGARYDQVTEDGRAFQLTSLTSNRPPGSFPVIYQGRSFSPSGGYWKTGEIGFANLLKADRIRKGGRTLRYQRFLDDFAAYEVTNIWTDTAGSPDKVYVVQTSPAVLERCILMATDPGDLVVDPTCGSGTTAFVAEQWGRRWITIDTSRVALALARTRLMAARYPWYLLADSREGRAKEAELTQRLPADRPIHNDIRQGFVYERVPHITLKSIANNPLIDDIWEKSQAILEPLRTELNCLKATNWEEWEIPHKTLDSWSANEAQIWAVAHSDQQPVSKRQEALAALNHNLGRAFTLDTLPPEPGDPWAEDATAVHTQWWEARIARQKKIDASIAAHADVEYLYDKAYVDNARVRVAGPFTVESLSPHRVLILRERLRATAASTGLKGFSDRFLLSEWTNVIDAWGLTSLDAYSTVQRMGRKSRLGPNQRARLWPVFQAIRDALAAERYTTWADVFTDLADALLQRSLKPFDHVVIDEAQDLAPAELKFFAAMAPGTADGLFLSGDVGQRIFQHPFSWVSLGVNVRGRSHTLKVCYRTSQQIRRAADRLLPTVLRDIDGLEDERRGIISVFDGPTPEVKLLATISAEADTVRQAVEIWLGEGIAGQEIGLFVRTPQLVARASRDRWACGR